jgi:hypothetical protein
MANTSGLTQGDAYRYIVHDQVTIPDLERETFSRIVKEELLSLSRAFSSVGIGKLRDGIRVWTEGLSEETLEIRADLLMSVVKGDEVVYIFVGSHGELYEVIVDVNYHHRTPVGPEQWHDRHFYYPAAYLGEVEVERLFDLGTEGFSLHRKGLTLHLVNVMASIEDLLTKKRRVEEERLKIIDTALKSVGPKKKRAEKARQAALQAARHC